MVVAFWVSDGWLLLVDLRLLRYVNSVVTGVCSGMVWCFAAFILFVWLLLDMVAVGRLLVVLWCDIVRLNVSSWCLCLGGVMMICLLDWYVPLWFVLDLNRV